MPEQLIRIDLIVAENDLEAANGVLALAAPFGWEEESLPTGESRLRVHTEDAGWAKRFCSTLAATLPHVRVEKSRAPKTDWAVAWRDFFTPVECGRHFLVLAPWMNASSQCRRIIIRIEPKTAFGTGHHPTTALCLAALSELLDQDKLTPAMRFLDVGTGSGILAIAAAKIGLTGLAVDIDSLAVDNACENAVANRVAGRIEIRQGSAIHTSERFDLILANILAQPLADMAPDLLARLKPNGRLILSGLLTHQAHAVESAYIALGLPPAQHAADGEWARLVWAL